MPTLGIPVQLSDIAQRPFVLLSVADSLLVGCTDTASQVIRTAIPLHLTDTVSSLSTGGPGEDLPLTISEAVSTSISYAIPFIDSLSISSSESIPVIASVFRTLDSCAIQASDATPSVVTTASSTAFISAVDALTLGCTDGPPPEFAALNAIDTLSVSIDAGIFGEETSIFGFTPQQFVSVSVVDSCKVQVITPSFPVTPKSASDIISMQVEEPPDSSQTIQPADILVIQSAEGAPIITFTASQLQLSVVDACLVGASDVSSTVKTTFNVFLGVTDSSALGESESILLATGFTLIGAVDDMAVQANDQAALQVSTSNADSAAISISEGITLLGQPVASDTLASHLTESAPVFNNLTNVSQAVTDTVVIVGAETFPILQPVFEFNVTDSLAIQETEGVPVFQSPQGIVTADSIGLIAQESTIINAVFLLADTARITANEAANVFLKVLAVTDAIGLPATEVSSLFSNFLTVTATDSGAVRATDLVSFVQQLLTQLSTSESLSVSAIELADIVVTQGMRDDLTGALVDLQDLLQQLFPEDAVAYQINAEDANVINPFVVNVFISLEDGLAIQTLEDTGSRPTTLTFYVDDAHAITIDDLSLKEIIPLVETLDFEIPTSYQTVSDPQSFQTVSSNFW